MDLKYFKKFVNSKSKIVVCMWGRIHELGFGALNTDTSYAIISVDLI
jgi:hypothetical protein